MKEVRQAKKEIDFEVKIGKRTYLRTYPFDKVHAVTKGGKRYVLTPKGDSSSALGASGSAKRSRAQVNRLIDQAGRSMPDWYEAVPLDYPMTLDLAWPKASGPWNANKNVGQHIWSNINENPRRWQSGTKFMHYVLRVNKGNADIEQKAFGSLGHCYHDLLGDWARAAFWWRKLDRQPMHSFLGLADCYWKLGSKEMASDLLRKLQTDRTRYGSAIKLWSDLGELDAALELAEASARAGYRGGAYMGAGGACRNHGRYAEAIAYYKKVLALPLKPKNGILERNQQRARIVIDNIQSFETLDVTRLADGTYTGTSLSYLGDLTVAVTVKAGRITAVRVTEHKDKQYYSALTDTPAKIIKKQGLKGVDATASATITSEAIIAATAKALAKEPLGDGS